MLCNVMLCNVMLCNVMLCNVMLCNVILCNYNGISDHVAQLITIHNINDFQSVYILVSYSIRKINQTATAEFSYNLSFESWENVFISEILM